MRSSPAVTSGSSDANAVSIISGGHVLAGTSQNRVDITALAVNAGVNISAALGIGDETEADTEANDQPSEAPGTANAITLTPNPLVIDTGALALSSEAGDINVTTIDAIHSGTVTATTGSINLVAEQDFTASNLSAPLGNVNLQGSGAVQLQQVAAGTGQGAVQGRIDIGAATTLSIGTATSGGTQTLTAEAT